MSRYFAGLAVPECPALLALKTGIETRARRAGLVLRETAAVDLHLTLYFFGALAPEKILEARAALAEATLTSLAVEFEAKGVGAFPEAGAARVVWAGLADSSSLRLLQKKLENALALRGFPREEKAFVPHITLLRLRPPADASALIAPDASKSIAAFRAHELVLYESRGGDNIPRYLPVQSFALSGAP